jgi:hypothetical protein
MNEAIFVKQKLSNNDKIADSGTIKVDGGVKGDN